VRGDDGRQAAGRGRPGRERHSQRGGGRRGDRAGRAVVEGNRVVGGHRIETGAGDRDLGRGDRRGSGLRVNQRRQRGHLHGGAAADAVRGDDGRQVAGCGRLGRERQYQHGGARRGDGAGGAVVEGNRVVGGHRIEAEAVDRHLGRG